MRTTASGWCPKHDRVYERADVCPDCGTQLVPIASATRPAVPRTADRRSVLDADVESVAEPAAGRLPPRSPWLVRGLVAATVVGAFVLGLIFPRGEQEPVVPGTLADARQLTAEQPESVETEGRIRLAALTQLGDRINATFRVILGPDPQRIVDATAEVALEPGGGSVDVNEVRVVSDPSGFVMTGRVASPGTVDLIRLTSIGVQVLEAPEWEVDISKAWPVGPNEPGIVRLKDTGRRIGEAQVSLRDVFTWRDRIEAVFELQGAQGKVLNEAELRVTTSGGGTNTQGRSIRAAEVDPAFPDHIVARFTTTSIPIDASRVLIRITNATAFVQGPWSWRVS